MGKQKQTNTNRNENRKKKKETRDKCPFLMFEIKKRTGEKKPSSSLNSHMISKYRKIINNMNKLNFQNPTSN